MSGYNLPDGCSCASDLDYGAEVNGPRRPECAICEFPIPVEHEDIAEQCANGLHGAVCTRWLCGACAPHHRVGDDAYCPAHETGALRIVLADVKAELADYKHGVIHAIRSLGRITREHPIPAASLADATEAAVVVAETERDAAA